MGDPVVERALAARLERLRAAELSPRLARAGGRHERDPRIRRHRGPGVADPVEVRIERAGHRPPVAGQGVEVVGVVAMGRRERVVAVGDEHDVAVADLEERVRASDPAR